MLQQKLSLETGALTGTDSASTLLADSAAT